MQLRAYQERSLTDLYNWLRNNKGNVTISLPTGSGKSVVIAELCRRALQEYPSTRILMLTKTKELIEQNAQKIRTLWRNAPMGIYSASVGKKQLGEPITVGGPQSIVNKIDALGHIDLLICDECHDISHKDEGSYRKIINRLLEINPAMRVIGYTASPFRLGHGLITDKPAIFDDIIEPVSIEEMIYHGYLSPLKSKMTEFQLDAKNVKKRGGEYIESELQKAVDTHDNNLQMVREVLRRAEGRKSLMFFCTGVNHAYHIRDLLLAHNVSAISVTGEMSKASREKAINDFRSGAIRAVTNVNCLSTGFDHAEIDLIVLARPTMSPGLYLQQCGRGMRIAPNKKDCLVLDFAGVVSQHGPITAVKPPSKAGSGDGEAPVRVCDECHEICHASVKVCPACGHEFPPPKEKEYKLHTDDIMGVSGKDLQVQSWIWKKHISRASKKEMLTCTIYGNLSDAPVTSYYVITHDGFAGQRARKNFAEIAHKAGVILDYSLADLHDIAKQMTEGKPPKIIEYKKDGKFFTVISHKW